MFRLSCSLLLACSLVGCQFGRFSASLNRDSRVPKLDFDRLPEQWEPDIDEEDYQSEDAEIG